MVETELEVAQAPQIESAPPAEAPDGEQPQRPRSKREESMARIAAHMEEVRAREIAYGAQQIADAPPEGDHGQPEPVADEPEEPPALAAAATPEPAPRPVAAPVAQPVAAPEPAQRRFRVDLDGAQFEVDEAQYAQLARMGAIANQALANYRTQQIAPAPQPPPQPAQAVNEPAISDDLARDLVRRLQYGDEADGAKALQSVIAQVVANSAPRIDPRQVVDAATQRALQQVQYRSDLERIVSEYPEIAHNDTLSQLAMLEMQKIARRDQYLGVSKTNLELHREACNMVRAALNTQPAPQPQSGVAAVTAAPQAAPANDRLERKRAAPRQPTAADRRTMAEEAPRFPTGSQIVEQMRRQRVGAAPLRP